MLQKEVDIHSSVRYQNEANLQLRKSASTNSQLIGSDNDYWYDCTDMVSSTNLIRNDNRNKVDDNIKSGLNFFNMAWCLMDIEQSLCCLPMQKIDLSEDEHDLKLVLNVDSL